MNLDRLKTIAGCYFKNEIGTEPDTLEVLIGYGEVGECMFEATLGDRQFSFWMSTTHNIIELAEMHRGTLTDAAALAGLEGNLNELPEP